MTTISIILAVLLVPALTATFLTCYLYSYLVKNEPSVQKVIPMAMGNVRQLLIEDRESFKKSPHWKAIKIYIWIHPIGTVLTPLVFALLVLDIIFR